MNKTKKLVVAALLLTLGLVLPFLTGQIQTIGNKLLPMHIPILICGFVCGWRYGLAVGFLAPILRHLLFGMPTPINAVCMACELATYGAVTGLVSHKLTVGRFRIYISLGTAMILGRLVWGVTSVIFYHFEQTAFTWSMFLGGALLNAIPGILLQLVLVPILMLALGKSGYDFQ